MATLTTKSISLTGTDGTLSAAAGGGDACQPGDHTWIEVVNGGTGSVTVTIDSVTPSSYGADDNIAVVLAPGADRLIGPLPASRFANAVSGLVTWTYSGTTSVTVGAFSG